MERVKDTENKLAFNREALILTDVKQDVDNSWSIRHKVRFLPDAACSASRLWLKAREVTEYQRPTSHVSL